MLNGPHVDAFHSNDPWQAFGEQSSFTGNAVLDPLLGQHEIEHTIWQELQQFSGGHFSSLIVRRMEGGVCLQGVLETGKDDFLGDVDSLVKRVACVDRVLNHLVIREPR